MSQGLEGYLYVLFDAYSTRCKIGRTTRTGSKRQRSIMGAHPVPTINVLYARVANCVASEAQCHRHFASRRVNGEWFDIQADEAIEYIHEHIDWCELDFESLGKIASYIITAHLSMGR
ncbi:GIY-YIG nuclease family protein [Caballeronia sp. LZ035]|uniref:GIY-YIG nuclease family protein n=1 Tax=Caballeronia sp. LZ035 TaxID=3038568 RepID=UPI0028586927|nr:GIY-YIG nuclease family protein [Caballeronia sp. LZ035]MDR5763483.1 GIY-YIG nuclease family protein [Caballeronia sp. LZ035]